MWIFQFSSNIFHSDFFYSSGFHMYCVILVSGLFRVFFSTVSMRIEVSYILRDFIVEIVWWCCSEALHGIVSTQWHSVLQQGVACCVFGSHHLYIANWLSIGEWKMGFHRKLSGARLKTYYEKNCSNEKIQKNRASDDRSWKWRL